MTSERREGKYVEVVAKGERFLNLSLACMRAMSQNETVATRRRPQVLISHPDGPMKPPPGFPRRELVSVSAAGGHNFAVDAERLLDWMLAHGLVTLRAAESPPGEDPKRDD